MDILWEFLENLFSRWPVMNSSEGHSVLLGRRRSIVRMIGTLLPFPKGQRVHLNLAVWHNDNEYQIFHDEGQNYSNPESTDEGLESASTFYLNNAQLQGNADMRKLLEEILELKMKMNEILEQHKAHSCGESAHCSSRSETSERVHSCNCKSAPSLAPPPPPPPMPPVPSHPMRPPLSTSTPGKRKSSKPATPSPDLMKDLMKELKENKRRLKSFPRTPGGRPKKRISSDNDTPETGTGNTLADILQRRKIKSEREDSDRP